LLPEGFRELARLREEVDFFRLESLMQQLMPYYNLKYPVKATSSSSSMFQASASNGNKQQQQTSPPALQSLTVINPVYETGSFVFLQ
jgi:hypothetical protein